MAIFNPAPNPTNDPEWLRSSKEPDRLKGDTSTGAMLEGFGQLVGPGIKGLDLGIQDALKKEARALIEPIRDAHGAGVTADEVPAIAGTGSRSAKFDTLAGVADEGKVPPGMASNLDGLRRMTDAYNQGGMSDSHYYASLDSVVSQLRSRFWGYEEHIDNAVKDITGVIPANALRTSILRDMNSLQAAAGNQEKELKTSYEKKNKYLLNYDGDMNIQKYAANRAFYDNVADKMEARDYNIKVQKDELELTDKVDDNTKKKYKELGIQEASNLVSDTIARASRTSGMSTEELAKQIQALGPTPDPKKVQALTQQVGILEAQLSSAVDALGRAPMKDSNGKVSSRTYMSVLGKDWTEVKGLAMSQVADMKALLADGNFGAMNAASNIAKQRAVVDRVNVEDKYSSLRMAGVIRTIAGDTAGGWAVQNSTALPDVNRAMVDTAVFGNVDPNAKAPPKAFDKIVNQIGAEAPNATGAKTQKVLQENFIKLTEHKDPNVAARSAAVLFQSPEYFIGLPTEQKFKAFQQLGSQAMTARIQELEKTAPGIKAQYTNWMEQSFMAFAKGSGAIDDAQGIIGSNRAEVKFNPETWQFTGRTKDFAAVKKAYPNAVDSTYTAFSKLNAVMSNMRPALEAQYGKDGATGRLFSLLSERGLDPSAPQAPGLIDKLGQAITDSIASVDWVSGTLGTAKKGKGNLTGKDQSIMDVKWDDIPEGMDAREFIKKLQSGK